MKPIAGIRQETIVWDNHTCMPLRAEDISFLPQLSRVRKNGIDVIGLNVGFDRYPWEESIKLIATFRRWIRQNGEHYTLVGNAAEIDQAKKDGKLGIFFDMEGGKVLDGHLPMVEFYYDLGVRWMLMAYNNNNDLGGGCHDQDEGLTPFGIEVLAEMNRLGMIPCCTHVGQKTALEVCTRSTSPVILSHSNPRAVWDHERNVSDEVLKACAGTGGVVGLNGIGIFLGNNDASIENYVKHLDYVVQLVGPDHVGIGLDYVFDQKELDDWVIANQHTFPPEANYTTGINMIGPEGFPQIAEALLKLGYKNEDLEKIFGGNFTALARKVWK